MIRKIQREKVRKIVNKHDPVKLLKMDCPVDEYDPEIDEILPALKKVKSVNQLHKKIYDIFVFMFDKDIAGPKERYRKLSEELYSLR